MKKFEVYLYAFPGQTVVVEAENEIEAVAAAYKTARLEDCVASDWDTEAGAEVDEIKGGGMRNVFIESQSGQISEACQDAGKWVSRVTLMDASTKKPIGESLDYGPFETEAQADDMGAKAVKDLARFMGLFIVGKERPPQ